jgi:hypothetical protein
MSRIVLTRADADAMAPVRDGRRQLKGGLPRDGNPPFLPELEGLEARATPTQAIVQVPPPASVQQRFRYRLESCTRRHLPSRRQQGLQDPLPGRHGRQRRQGQAP